MGGSLFEDWLQELDQKVEKKGRNVALKVDNCPAHSEITCLTAIDVHFLPPNTTSNIQSMDQRVIGHAFYFCKFYTFFISR